MKTVTRITLAMCLSLTVTIASARVNSGRDVSLSYKAFSEAVESAGLPELFSYIPLMLTGGDERFSDTYTAGAWALSAPVARYYGHPVTDTYDSRLDLDQCTSAAVSYLKDLMEKDNASPEAVLVQYLAANHHLSAVPSAKEALAALEKTARAYASGEFSTDDAQSGTVSVTLDKQLVTAELCRTLSISATWFYTANPAVIFGAPTIPAGATILIPADKAELFNSKISAIYDSSLKICADTVAIISPVTQVEVPQEVKEKPIPVSQTYKVKSGDTLGHIAARHHTTVTKIKQLNNLKSDNIREGQVLKIPQ